MTDDAEELGRLPQRARAFLLIAVLAAVLTISAILKPILWDDEVYFQFAQYIAGHPLDPYGVEIWSLGLHANGLYVLAPPLLLYWWAGAIALLGPRVAPTMIALFPFALSYVASFHAVARRFAPAIAPALTVLAATGPWALVSINYMLDFPGCALVLGALALFIRAADGDRPGLAIAAGAIAALAMETKYNAAVSLPLFLLYGALLRRWWTTAAAVLAGITVFTGCESLIWLRYGHSHFLLHLSEHPVLAQAAIREAARLRELTYGLIENGGPLLFGLLPIALAALDCGRRRAGAVMALAAAAFALALIGHDRLVMALLPGSDPRHMPTLLTLSGLLGILVASQAGRLALRWIQPSRLLKDPERTFLLAWLLLEILTYFVLSPFPAARRLGGVLVALLLFLGRCLARRAASARKPALAGAILLNGVAGLAMLAICLVDGWNAKMTAEAAIEAARGSADGHEVWQLTSLSFDQPLSQAGMRRVNLDESRLQPGDLLVAELPDVPALYKLDSLGLQPVATVRKGVDLGLRVSTDFFRNQLPWVPMPDSRPSLILYRATRSTVLSLN